MTEPIAATREPRAMPSSARRALTYSPWYLVAGWFVQTCLRLAMSWGRDTPLVYPDEAGYLVAARWLAGGTATDLSGQTFYQGGYALLLAPAHLLSDDPAVVYRIVMAINAPIGALAFPLAYLLLRRCGVRHRGQAFFVAWAASMLPASALYNGVALADAVLPVVVLGWLVALDRFVRLGGPRSAAVASLLAAYAYSIHLRGTVVLLVHVAVVVVCLVRGHARRAVAVAFGVAASGAVAALLLNRALTHALYPAGSRSHDSILMDRLTSLDGQLRAITGALGQLWAMMVGSWGLAALGIATVLVVLVRRDTAANDRIMAGALLALSVGIGYASSAALQDEHRVSNFAYGRYASCAALAWTLVGLAALMRGTKLRRRLPLAALLILATGSWLVLYLGTRLRTYDMTPWDFPETAILGGTYEELRPMVISVVACLLLGVLWALCRWGPVKLFIGLLTVNLLLTILPVVGWVSMESRSPMPPLPGPSSGGVAFARHVRGVDHPPPDLMRPLPELIYARLSYQVWWTELERFDPADGLPHAGICKVIVHWPAGVVPADSWPEHPPGWRFQRSGALGVLWWVVWYDPNCPGND